MATRRRFRQLFSFFFCLANRHVTCFYPSAEQKTEDCDVKPVVLYAFYPVSHFRVHDDRRSGNCNGKDSRIPTTASEPHADIFHVAGFAEPVQNTMDSVAAKTPSRDEIRLIQERMKAAGVNPGAADGVIGPKTIAALQRFQSACATLNDLLDRAGTQGLAQAVDSRELKLNAVVNETPTKDEIRLLQPSLKAAGFDPGPSMESWALKRSRDCLPFNPDAHQ